jgi:hypothetical protein
MEPGVADTLSIPVAPEHLTAEMDEMENPELE